MKNLLFFVLLLTNLKLHATWSIILVDSATGEIGIAGASCTFDCSGIESIIPGKGAIIVQAMSNYNALDVGRRLIREGYSLNEILNKVLRQARFDPEHQQYALVTVKEMQPLTYSGDSILPNKGALTGRGISVQGNLLTSQRELRTIYEAALKAQKEGLGIYETLLRALEAGAKAGGDKRCGAQKAQSAFMRVAGPHDREDQLTLDLVVRQELKTGMNAVSLLRKRFNAWKMARKSDETSH